MAERRHGGGMVANTQNWGDSLVAEGRAILHSTPQCVFATFPYLW